MQGYKCKHKLTIHFCHILSGLQELGRLHIIKFDWSMILAIPKREVGSKIDNPV